MIRTELSCAFDNNTNYLTMVRFSYIIFLSSAGVGKPSRAADTGRFSMKAIPLTKAQFDAKRSELEALAKAWADRECTSFDEAVHPASSKNQGGGSIWRMPAIDSKRVVSLLVELEPVLGCNLPSSLVRRGGYVNRDQLAVDLLSRIRQWCIDGPPSTVGATAADSVTSTPDTSRPSPI